jgi:hypothetical protein
MDQKEDHMHLMDLKRRYYNESLEEFVTNKNEFERIVENKGELIQKTDPIYLDPSRTFIKAHFYAPRKQIFGHFYKTYWVNIIVIWASTILLYIVLYYRLLKKLLDSSEKVKVKSH